MPRWKTNEELEFLKLEFQKKWYFANYFRNSVFLLKISKNCGIGPFWPSFLFIYSIRPHLLGSILFLYLFITPILLFKKGLLLLIFILNLTLQGGPSITPLPKGARGPTFGLYFSISKQFYFLGHHLVLIYAFSFLWAFRIQSDYYLFAHALTHLLGLSWAFLLMGFWMQIFKNTHQQVSESILL